MCTLTVSLNFRSLQPAPYLILQAAPPTGTSNLTRPKPSPPCSFSRAAVTKPHILSSLNTRDLFSCGSGDWRSNSKITGPRFLRRL